MPVVARKTPADLMKTKHSGPHYELVDGQFIERHTSIISAHAAQTATFKLHDDVRGWVFGAGLGYQCFRDDPDRVRFPSSSFLRHQQWHPRQRRDPEYSPDVPAFVIEAIAHDTTTEYLELKIKHWLEAGVELIWVIDPFTHCVTTFTPDCESRIYHDLDFIPGTPVFEDVQYQVKDFFRYPPLAD